MQVDVDGVVNWACWTLVRVETEERGQDETGHYGLNTGERLLRGVGRVEIRCADDSVVTALALPDLPTLPGAAMTARVALPATLKGSDRLRVVVNYGEGSVAAAERGAAIP